MQKTAIQEESDQSALFSACESDSEFIPIWLMMRCGMHSYDVANAKTKLSVEGQFLTWKRAKNSRPRREIVPSDVMPRLKWWLARGKKLTPRGYNLLAHRIGERTGHPECSPMVLRKTFCLQELRRFMKMNPQPPDLIGLVATKMGCDRSVVQENYIDLIQWEGLGGKK